MRTVWKSRAQATLLILAALVAFDRFHPRAIARPERGAKQAEPAIEDSRAPRGANQAATPAPTPRPEPTPPPSPVYIFTPTSEPPAQAGRFGSPRKITIEVSNFVNGILRENLAASDFAVEIGGAAAQVFFAIRLHDRYVLVVVPPTKPSAGVFDLKVSVLGAMAVSPASIQYTVDDRLHADVSLTIDRSGSMFGDFIEGAHEASSLFVDQMASGDRAAVIGFDHVVEVPLPLTLIRDSGASLFNDDMENGINGWTAQPPWGQETFGTPPNSATLWSDSPGGATGDNVNSLLRMPVLNLTGAQGPFLQFDHIFDLEDGWDYGEAVVTVNGGATYSLLRRYSGYSEAMQRALLDLTPYVGQPAVEIIFHVRTDFFTEPGITFDGWYIDNVSVGESETRSAVKSAIQGLYPRGATSIGGGLLQAQAQLDGFANSGSVCWTDSPDGLYFNGIEESLRTPVINLAGVPNPELVFSSRYELEDGFDFGKVFASTNNGTTWTEIASLTGSSDWNQRTVSLLPYAGATALRLDFRIVTDNSLRADGWYIDDVIVRSATTPATVAFADDMESGVNGWSPEFPWAQNSGRGSPDHAWSIVLLSDGFENYPPFVASVLPRIVNSRTRVFTIALGPEADQALLQYIANQTGGSFYLAPGPEDLPPIYSAIAGEVNRVQKLIEKTGTISQGLIVDEVALVDSDASPVTFSINWPGSDSDLDLILRTPSGATINPLSPAAIYSESSRSRTYRIVGPESGLWTLRTTGSTVPSGPPLAFNTIVYATTNLEIFAYIDRHNDLYFADESMWILAGAADGSPLLGATVTAEVSGPLALGRSTAISTITLHDDGLNRDGAAGDGLYGAQFTDTGMPGGYKVSVAVEGTSTGGDSFRRTSLSSTRILLPPPASASRWDKYR